MNYPPSLTISLSETFRCDDVKRGPNGVANVQKRVQGEGRVQFDVHNPHHIVLPRHDLARVPLTVFVDFKDDTTEWLYGQDATHLGVFQFWSTEDFEGKEQARLQLTLTLPETMISRFENQTPTLHVLVAALNEWRDEDFNLKWDGDKGALYVKEVTVVGATTVRKNDVAQGPSERETLSRIGEILIRAEKGMHNFSTSARTLAVGVFWICLAAYLVYFLREAVRWVFKF